MAAEAGQEEKGQGSYGAESAAPLPSEAGCSTAQHAAGGFTPGPWAVNGSHIYAPDGAIIAVAWNPGSRESDYPLVPNRDLMAAAPELLEALKAVKEHDEFVPVLPRNVLAKVDAAIAKATGRDPR